VLKGFLTPAHRAEEDPEVDADRVIIEMVCEEAWEEWRPLAKWAVSPQLSRAR